MIETGSVIDALCLTGMSLEELPGVEGAYHELMVGIERVAASRDDVLDLDSLSGNVACVTCNEMAVVALEVGRRFGADGVMLEDVTPEVLAAMFVVVAEEHVAAEVRHIFRRGRTGSVVREAEILATSAKLDPRVELSRRPETLFIRAP